MNGRRYGRDLRQLRQFRSAMLFFVVVSFVAAGIAGFFGAELDEYAPVRGGGTIQLGGEGAQ